MKSSNNKPKVSVVVPIYGVEKYLNQCVDSILAQTLKEIEIILVDDGSKDRCPEIIDEYAKKDKRIVAIHQPNGGYGRAVNHGIEVATGEYIGIVEPDDWIDNDMYETLYNDAKTHNVDIVKAPYNEYFDTDNGIGKRWVAGPLLEIKPITNPFSIYDYPLPLTHHASIWTAIYKSSLIKKNNIKVLERNKGRYADQNWRYETLMMAKNIYWEKKSFYNYRLTNENASSYKKNNPDDIFDIYEELDVFLNKHPQQFEKIKEYLYIEIYRHMFWNLERVDNKFKNYCLKRIHNQFKKMNKNIIKKSCLFTSQEKKKFFAMASSSYLYHAKMKKLCESLFSIKNSGSKRYKIINLLGIKLKFKRNEYLLQCMIKDLSNQILRQEEKINLLRNDINNLIKG